LAASSTLRTLVATVAGVDVVGTGLVIHYTPVRGQSAEIEDFICLGPRGDLNAVEGVGRLLRILRAGRVAPPPDPYALDDEIERAVELVERCRGARVQLRVERRVERTLTVWTESGVDRIGRVIDYEEVGETLTVRRHGAQSVLRIPRRQLIRYAPSAREYLEVVSLDLPDAAGLP
jgi:hypothetical protein